MRASTLNSNHGIFPALVLALIMLASSLFLMLGPVLGEGNPDITLSGDNIHMKDEITDGDNVTIHAVIHNNGNGNASDILVNFRDYSHAEEKWHAIGNRTIRFMEGQSSYNLSIVWHASPAGNHTILVKIDPENTINESNESNNNAHRLVYVKEKSHETWIYGHVRDKETHDELSDVTVTITGQECNCSYTVHTDRNGYYEQKIDHAGNYTVKAQRDGYKSESRTVYAKEGQETKADFYLEKEGGHTKIRGYVKEKGTNESINDAKVTISGNNESYTAYSDWNGSYSKELEHGGNYTVTAEKSGYKSQTEHVFIENGDHKRVNFYLEKVSGEVFPDLTIKSITCSQENPDEGTIAVINAIIWNKGPGDAENITVTFTDNADGMLRVVKTIGTVVIPELRAGQTTTVGVEWNTTGQAGENIITVHVDPNKEINESDEQNKELYTKVWVNGGENGYSVSITASARTFSLEGKNYTSLTLSVKNTGRFRDSYTLSITGSYSGWTASVDSPSFELEPGAEKSVTLVLEKTPEGTNTTAKTVTVTITVRSAAYPDVQDSVTVEGKLTTDNGAGAAIPVPSTPLIAAALGAGALVVFFRRRN